MLNAVQPVVWSHHLAQIEGSYLLIVYRPMYELALLAALRPWNVWM